MSASDPKLVERLERERDDAVARYAEAVAETKKHRDKSEERRLMICRYMNDEHYRAAEARTAALEAENGALREGITATIKKVRPYSSFNTETNGRPMRVQGETEFMMVKEAQRLMTSIWDELNAVLSRAALRQAEEKSDG